MKKILCIGDSLALPGHGNSYEDTWYYKISNFYSTIDFIPVFKRAITTEILNEWGGGENYQNAFPKGADCLEHYMPQLIIIQLGIVDCAPRLIKKGSLESFIISRLSKNLQNKYITWLKKRRNRKMEFSYVQPDKFSNNLIKYFNRCDSNKIEKVIFIKIPIPDERIIKKSPFIVESVTKYNSIVENLKSNYSFLKTIEPLNQNEQENIIFDDGYHPNKTGHEVINEELKNIINASL